MALNFGLIKTGLFPVSEESGEGVSGDRIEQVKSSDLKYLSIHGNGFNCDAAGNAYEAQHLAASIRKVGALNLLGFATGINLPDGAEVLKVQVWGTNSSRTWVLNRANRSGGQITMAGATLNTADTSIISPIIDNENYSYTIRTSAFDTNENLYGALITYTEN